MGDHGEAATRQGSGGEGAALTRDSSQQSGGVGFGDHQLGASCGSDTEQISDEESHDKGSESGSSVTVGNSKPGDITRKWNPNLRPDYVEILRNPY